MVFGRKATEDTLVKPCPPNVDQILEDLKSAEPEDPVFTLNPSLLTEVSLNTETDADRNYSDVIAYVAKEKQINNLQEKLFSGFDILQNTQKELETASNEVAEQLDNIKKERLKINVRIDSNTEESLAEDSSEDLC